MKMKKTKPPKKPSHRKFTNTKSFMKFLMDRKPSIHDLIAVAEYARYLCARTPNSSHVPIVAPILKQLNPILQEGIDPFSLDAVRCVGDTLRGKKLAIYHQLCKIFPSQQFYSPLPPKFPYPTSRRVSLSELRDC